MLFRSTQNNATAACADIGEIVVQTARWMNWTGWGWKDEHYYSMECAQKSGLEDLSIRACSGLAHPFATQEPPSIYAWLEQAMKVDFNSPFPSLDAVLNVPLTPNLQSVCERYFPLTIAMSKFLLQLHAPRLALDKQIEAILESSISSRVLDILPDAVVTMLKSAIIQRQSSPPTTWPSALLSLIDREDLMLLASSGQPQPREMVQRRVSTSRIMYSP